MNKNNVVLCEIQDALEEKVNVTIHDAVIRMKSKNRLDVIEDGAKEVEKLSKELQEHVKSMRKNKS